MVHVIRADTQVPSLCWLVERAVTNTASYGTLSTETPKMCSPARETSSEDHRRITPMNYLREKRRGSDSSASGLTWALTKSYISFKVIFSPIILYLLMTRSAAVVL